MHLRTARRSRRYSGIVLLVIGVAALALAFYRFICCSEVQRGVVLVGAVGLLAGAAIDSLNDWRQRK
jgi:hypothetical protein